MSAPTRSGNRDVTLRSVLVKRARAARNDGVPMITLNRVGGPPAPDVDQPPAHQRGQGAGNAADGRPTGDGPGLIVFWPHRQDQPDGRRHDERRSGPLHGPAQHQHPEFRCQPAADRTKDEQGQANKKGPLAT